MNRERILRIFDIFSYSFFYSVIIRFCTALSFLVCISAIV